MDAVGEPVCIGPSALTASEPCCLHEVVVGVEQADGHFVPSVGVLQAYPTQTVLSNDPDEIVKRYRSVTDTEQKGTNSDSVRVGMGNVLAIIAVLALVKLFGNEKADAL